MTISRLLLFSVLFGVTLATWSLTGYACNQPQIYNQCNCQSFCDSYMQQQPPCGYSGGCGGGGYDYGYHPRRRHRIRHKKRKHRYHSSEQEEELPPPPRKRVKVHEEQGFIEERRTTTEAPATLIATKDSSWENEDLWEKKFVTNSPTTSTWAPEDFVEITSEEVAEAMRSRTAAPRVAPQVAPSSAGQGIGVNTGLGIGAPGIGGLGGGGGLFGISSGVGVGVPGVGPIGISSGLGIGKK